MIMCFSTVRDEIKIKGHLPLFALVDRADKYLGKEVLFILNHCLMRGKVVLEGEKVFLLQNHMSGYRCKNTEGYAHSWSVGSGNKNDTLANSAGIVISLITTKKQLKEQFKIWRDGVRKAEKRFKKSPLYFYRPGDESQELSRVQRAKTDRSLVLEIILHMNFLNSYTERGIIDTDRGRLRSSGDIYRHYIGLKREFPNLPELSLEKIMKCLVSLIENNELSFHFCSDIFKLVFYQTDDIVYTDEEPPKDEYGGNYIFWTML